MKLIQAILRRYREWQYKRRNPGAEVFWMNNEMLIVFDVPEEWLAEQRAYRERTQGNGR